MEENKYNIPEDYGTKVAEPVVAYGVQDSHNASAIDELMIDYSDSSLYENDGIALPYEKDSYTPEELRTILINDLKEFYGVKDAV